MKKDYFLYIAILIPILMVISTAASVLFYQVDSSPEENFIYIAAQHYGSYHCVHDVKARLFPEHAANRIPNHSNLDDSTCADTHLYIYNFKNKSNTQISLENAQQLALSDKLESSDGFKVEQYCSSGTSFMWPFEMTGGYQYDVCIRKDNYTKKISIPLRENQFNSFQFIAWIKNANQATEHKDVKP